MESRRRARATTSNATCTAATATKTTATASWPRQSWHGETYDSDAYQTKKFRSFHANNLVGDAFGCHCDSVGFWGATEVLLVGLSLERWNLPKGALLVKGKLA
jgi:hypothetical protein